MFSAYYDPSIGRFLSTDPVQANANTGASFNRYWYAANNPYKFTDPDGRQERISDVRAYSDPVQRRAEEIAARQALGLSVDFTPVIGDVKGFIDAYNNQTVSNVVGAVVGLFGPAGDAARKLIKGVDNLASAARIARPADGISMGTNEALDAATSYLGDGYKMIDSGVYRSADGTRQVRMTDRDLNHPRQKPHMNFEEGRTTTNHRGTSTFEAEHNSHVYLPEEKHR